jgi:hypothetical protein
VTIGRDHIASTVNTLVLAYAGASLPLLLLFTQAGRRLADVAAGELVAVEVVRTLVGSIGLVTAVPVTTALAVLVISKGRGPEMPAAPPPAPQPAPVPAAPGPPPLQSEADPEPAWDQFAPEDPPRW